VDSNIYQGASSDKNVTVSNYQLNIDTQKSTAAHKNCTFQVMLMLSQLRESGLTLSNSQFLPVSCYQNSWLDSLYCMYRVLQEQSAGLWENIPYLFIYIIILFQNLYTAVRPMDIGTVKE
jgi:hypothetical protein